MSKRIWIGLFLCFGVSATHAGPAEPATSMSHQSLRLGDSSWYLYRSPPRNAAIYDLDYMMGHLRCDLPEYALRFSESLDFAFEIKFAPLLDRNDFVGPVYDMDIGATQLVISIRF